jgi:alpha-galactosidase
MALGTATARRARAVSPTPTEMAQARQWIAANFDGRQAAKPREAGRAAPLFSFAYGGQPSAELLGTWTLERAARPLDARRTQRTLTYADPKTGLELCCAGVEYHDFPAVEWVVHLQNKGRVDTPILESIQAIDATLPLPEAGQPVLHWAKGGVASLDDFAPRETALTPGAPVHLQPGGGRSSDQVLPFFTVARPGGGVVLALGWSGEWAADFSCGRRGVQMKAGMARTRLRLHPGEGIRTPRILLVFYGQDRWRGQNLSRQLILSHYRPKCNGRPLVAPVTWGTWGGSLCDVHLDYIQKIIEHDLPIDYYWMDAEWYGQAPWWKSVGDWQVRKDLFPRGFKPLCDALSPSGRQLMVWFEPERVFKGTPWHKAHRDWLIDVGDDNCLFNLGNPSARKFLTDFISAKVEQFGLGCYRQDFNMSPLPYWRAADPADRQGIAEIRHIEGLYAFWDELRARHPHLIIDNCASGGRRIDLETTARSTPFWRSDGPRDAVAHQCHTYGLMPWVPLNATSQDLEGNDYEFRSSISSALCVNWFHSGDGPMKKLPADFPFAWGKRVLGQYLRLRPFYYGDYYPLLPYRQDRTAWMAWQFDRPDLGEGMVQAFRRDKSPDPSARVKFHGLAPDARYALADLDTAAVTEMTGRDLMTDGLAIAASGCPGAVVVTYKRSR